MTTAVIPDDGFTIDDWAATPEDDGRRWELIEGALVVSPPAFTWHAVASNGLADALRPNLPEHLRVLHESGVVLDRRNAFIPDVIVVDRRVPAPGERDWLKGGHVVLAAEVESPSSRGRDRLLKPDVYARNGIAHFWRVEREGELITVVAHELLDGVYVEVARATGDEELRVSVPYDISLRPSDLGRL